MLSPSRIVSVVTPTTHVGAWNREAADDRLQPSKRSRRVSRAVVVHGGQAKQALGIFRSRFPQTEIVLLSTCNRIEVYTANADSATESTELEDGAVRLRIRDSVSC